MGLGCRRPLSRDREARPKPDASVPTRAVQRRPASITRRQPQLVVATARRCCVGPGKSLALSEVSRRASLDEALGANAETLSITRLEGSRCRGGRLWSYKPDSPMLG